MNDEIYIFAIETSCDDTSIAIMRNNAVLSNIVSSQQIHELFGGVVPELASREHDKILPQLFKDCFKTVDFSSYELDLIAVTQGPGLAGSLISGASSGIRSSEKSIFSGNFNAYTFCESPSPRVLKAEKKSESIEPKPNIIEHIKNE